MAFDVRPIPIIKRLFGYLPGRKPEIIEPQGPPDEALIGFSGMASEALKHQLELATDRVDIYKDIENMDQDDVISSALDLIAGDCTQLDVNTGKAIWVEAKDTKIQKIANDLLSDLETEDEIFSIIRETAKYGDSFSSLFQEKRADGTPGGIVKLGWKDPKLMHRHEDKFGRLEGFSFGNEPDDKVMSAPWQYAHFRLLGRDRGSKYGTSYVAAARRLYRRLRMMEDALAIYRIKRTPDRFVFAIKGLDQLPPEDRVEAFAKIRQNFRKRMLTDPNTGNIRSEMDPFCFTGDTKVSLLDGRELSFVELLNEFGDKPFWVYSYDRESGRIVPGRAHNLGITGKSVQKLVKVVLDNGQEAKCTLSHKWMLRDGSYRQAQDLKPGDSLMPLYRKLSENGIQGYELLYQPCEDKWHFTHRQFVLGEKKEIIHHRNYNKRDNTPENLKWMMKHDHHILHSDRLKVYNSTPEKRAISSARNRKYREICSRALTNYNASEKHTQDVKRSWENPERKKKMQDLQKVLMAEKWKNPEFREKASQCASDRLKAIWADPDKKRVMVERQKESRKKNEKERVEKQKATRRKKFEERKLAEAIVNHKVASVEIVDSCEDVYDIHVEKYHNFALSIGVHVHNSVDEDFFIDDESIRIDKLVGSQTVGHVLDVDYVRKRLYSTLRIPPDYMGFSEAKGGFASSSPLSYQDIQFAREMKRVQRSGILGYIRIIQVHLAWSGIDPLEPSNEFFIHMSPVSFLDEMQRAQVLQVKAATLGILKDIGKSLDLDNEQLIPFLVDVSGLPKYLSQISKDREQVGAEAPLSGSVDLVDSQKREFRKRLEEIKKMMDSKGINLEHVVRTLVLSPSMSSLSPKNLGKLPDPKLDQLEEKSHDMILEK